LTRQLAILKQQTDPLQDSEYAGAVVCEARQHALALGLPDLIPEVTLQIGNNHVMPPRDAQQSLSRALAGLPVTTVQSPYLDSQQAADYLQVTMKSLYELVGRRRLNPLRGPRRSYRFTRQQLDEYLAQNT
jgi:excisionase family DNA binding protein